MPGLGPSIAKMDPAVGIINPQQACPLFSTLPGEIRTSIFELALTSYDDVEKPYRADRTYYRPGYHYHQKVDWSLLLTCQRIYYETRLLPVALNEHSFWLFNGPWMSIGHTSQRTANWGAWFSSLNPDQKGAVRRVHIFAQQYFLEQLGLRKDAARLNFDTNQLRLTFRHSDWWSWQSPVESSDRLGICPWISQRVSCQRMLAEPLQPDLAFIEARMNGGTWGWQICHVNRLELLEIEFEIDVVKKEQLQTVLERARHWKFPISQGRAVLEWTGELREYSWQGLADVKNEYQRLKETPVKEGAMRTYYVAIMVWKKVNRE